MTQPVVAHSVNPYLFGTGSWVHGQIRTLRRWKAIVVCKRRENADQFPFEPVYALQDLAPLAILGQRLGRRLGGGAFPFMRAAIARHGACLLHSHFASQGAIDLALVRASGVAHVASFYGADIWKNSRDPRWLARYAELFASGASFLVEGAAMKAKVESLGCAPDRIVVQHLGVDVGDTPFVARELGSDGLVRVLASGRAVEKKGHELAVRAFARAVGEMPRLRLSLMILAKSDGELARLERLKELVRELGLAGSVDFPPPRSYAEYRRSLYGYHVFLAPSLHASDGDAEGGAPVSLIDMSATGMPIVASKHCDIPEVAPEGVSGRLFDEGDVEGCAEALLEVARAPERWSEYGRAGRAHVERDYDAATQVTRLESIYDRAVEARSPPLAAARTGPG